MHAPRDRHGACRLINPDSMISAVATAIFHFKTGLFFLLLFRLAKILQMPKNGPCAMHKKTDIIPSADGFDPVHYIAR